MINTVNPALDAFVAELPASLEFAQALISRRGEAFELRHVADAAVTDSALELVEIESRSNFPENIEVGMQFERVSPDGEEEGLYTVTDITDDRIVIDGNHPLAGTALVFSCTVAEIRKASAEELTHGHVHGEHGHQH